MFSIKMPMNKHNEKLKNICSWNRGFETLVMLSTLEINPKNTFRSLEGPLLRKCEAEYNLNSNSCILIMYLH